MINPVTGVEEDIDPITGLPKAPDPLAMPNALPVLDQQTTGLPGGGGASLPASSPGAAISLLPPQAAHETEVSHQFRSPETKIADTAVATAVNAQGVARTADTAAKIGLAEADATGAENERQLAEREAHAKAIQDEIVRKKNEENMAADARMREASIKQGKANLDPVRTRSALETFATVLATIGQGLASVTEGSQVWARGNPVAKLYDDQWQAQLAKGRKEFEESERARKLQKEGRDAELQAARHELEIGITNRFLAAKGVEAAWIKERAAKMGPAGAKATGALMDATEKLTTAKALQANAQNYDARSKVTDRTQDPSAAASKMSSTEQAAAADIATAAGLIEDFKAGPKLTQDAIDKFNSNKEAVDATAGPKGVTGTLVNKAGRAFGVIPEGVFQDVPLAQQAQLSRVDKLRTIQQKLMTGAGVTGAEMSTYAQQFGVTFGDSPPVIQQKMDGLTRTLQERAVAAGSKAPELKSRLDAIQGKPSLREQVGAKFAKPGVKRETKKISTGTFERTGPGPMDWKRIGN